MHMSCHVGIMTQSVNVLGSTSARRFRGFVARRSSRYNICMCTRLLMKLLMVLSLSMIPLATWADDIPAPATTDQTVQTVQTAPGVAASSSLGPQQGATGTG